MKLLLWTCVVSALVAGAPALAQTATPENGKVAVTGTVAPVCILGAPSPATVDMGVLSETAGPRAGKLASLAAQSVVLPSSYCNFAGSALTVTTEALLSADTVTPQVGFARAVNYTATASGWTSSPTSSTSSATGIGGNPAKVTTGATQPSPRLSDISVQLSNFTAPSDAFLVAGAYSGTVTVTLGPATNGG